MTRAHLTDRATAKNAKDFVMEEIVVTPGYWWATLVSPTRMPEGEDWVSGRPEIVEVNDNNGEGDEALSVQVFGVPVTQWPRNFTFHRPVAAEQAHAADLARLKAERDALEMRAVEAEYRLLSWRQGRAARHETIAKFIRERAPDLWPDYAAISVNGSIYSDGYTLEPTYEQQMNSLRWRVESAEREAAEARAHLKEGEVQS